LPFSKDFFPKKLASNSIDNTSSSLFLSPIVGYNASKPYEGKVKAVVKVKGHKYFRICYTDGDEEDITQSELQKILIKDDAKSGKKRKSDPDSKKATAEAEGAAAVATKRSKQRKLSAQPTRGKRRVPAEEKISEEEEEEKEESPAPAAIASARARISSILTAGKNLTTGGDHATQEDGEQQEQVSTEKEEESNGEQEENETGIDVDIGHGRVLGGGGIAPHELLHLSGQEEEKEEGGHPQERLETQKQQEDSIQRFDFLGPSPTDGISASAAVAANGFLFIGDITRPTPIDNTFEMENTPPALYTFQILKILEDFDEILKKVNIGKEGLISVDVQFKDSAVGYAPFVEEWNKWLGDTPAPVSTKRK
jgi:enamine deaminase RidA (YjgF/YER057c/UK114 family)